MTEWFILVQRLRVHSIRIGKSQREHLAAAGHIAVGKQRELNTATLCSFLFLLLVLWIHNPQDNTAHILDASFDLNLVRISLT